MGQQERADPAARRGRADNSHKHAHDNFLKNESILLASKAKLTVTNAFFTDWANGKIVLAPITEQRGLLF